MLAGDSTHDAGVTETVVLAERISRELRRRRFARGALRVESPEAAFSFDGDGGIADAWLDAEPAAHALVEELMILANEAVAGFLSRPARGDALPRARVARGAIDRPARDRARRARRPDAADAGGGEPDAARGGSARRRDLRAGAGLRRELGSGPLCVPLTRPARAQAGALRPGEPRPLRPPERRLLPFHVADPPLPGSRLPSRSAARHRRGGRSTAGRHRRGGGADLDAGAASGGGGARRRRHLPRVAPRAAAVRERLGRDLRRRDHGLDRRRPVRAIRRRVRGIRPLADDPRRLLRADAARHRPPGPARRTRVPPRRPARRARGGGPAHGGEGRARWPAAASAERRRGTRFVPSCPRDAGDRWRASMSYRRIRWP